MFATVYTISDCVINLPYHQQKGTVNHFLLQHYYITIKKNTFEAQASILNVKIIFIHKVVDSGFGMTDDTIVNR